ncbi:MAG: hypothetical protein WAV84_15495, partial [Bacteroidota bacterium]
MRAFSAREALVWRLCPRAYASSLCFAVASALGYDLWPFQGLMRDEVAPPRRSRPSVAQPLHRG